MAPIVSRETIGTIRVPAYTYLGLTMILQLVDYILVTAPLRVGVAAWRFSAFGTLSSTMGNLVLLVLCAFVMAFIYSDTRILGFLSVFTGVVGTVLLLLSVGFILDGFQLRSGLQAQQLAAFQILWVGAFLKILAMTIVSFMFAAAGFRAWRSAARESARESHRNDRGGDDLLIRPTGAR